MARSFARVAWKGEAGDSRPHTRALTSGGREGSELGKGGRVETDRKQLRVKLLQCSVLLLHCGARLECILHTVLAHHQEAVGALRARTHHARLSGMDARRAPLEGARQLRR